ncbi:phage regulatory protein/antirepressor Ant [Acinetobacter baumannii]|uniref:Rha family transcriptional regulator n=1 Tax=Acinetobacter baumannii TaxID=470 RepID=UPI000DE6CCBB|nr:phage regulatory protein/antirepressor Ant [Acinetobacter baumannii]MDE3319634.1 phage regulatory protein/antirepressor Ant [Acinetobacter baumannii]MDX5549694.1 phage regulatory protein/antirepressor Ant [Acinetobacter baumannii]SSQ09991.1 DNA-binding protein [Acinetobacter baumannii]SSR14416.1 DNA-binding protein [Acinetobacter baumannii]HCT3680061.1 phage regulatory protein/antirepressor Ant [Acinetobacter baumannii]
MTSLSLQTQNSTPFNTAINTSILVVPTPTVQTMSSKEIADMTGKEHYNVLADIRNMFEQLQIDSTEFSGQYKDSTGRTLPCFNLNKDLSICLVSGYNVQLRMAIIKRWNELESQAQQNFALPTTFSQALLLAAQLEEQKEQLALQVAQQQQVIEVQQVDVDALERIASRKGSMTVRDAAKLLNMRPIDLRDWMLANKWTYSPYKGKYRPTAAHATAGHLTLSANDYDPLVRVTWKGLALLAKRLNVTLDTDNI